MNYQPINSNFGPGLIKQGFVFLDNTALKALPSTFYTVVQGTDNILLIPILTSVIINTLAGAYTNVTSGRSIYIAHGAGASVISTIGFDVPAGADFISIPLIPRQIALETADLAGSIDIVTDIIGQPLTISMSNTDGDLEDGAEGNYLKVVMLYTALDITTGQFLS